MTTSADYPKFWVRVEILGCPWTQVDREVYLAVESKWTRSRDAADFSSFWGNGVGGYVQWFAPKTEKDVIEGVH